MKNEIKNLLIISLSLIFGLGVVAFSAFRVSQVGAQSESEEKVEVINLGEEKQASEEASKAPEVKTEVDYYLPYPGILPDHPLYWLKMVRDRILLATTQKPEDKYERLLLYADKRIGAAQVLCNGGKAELGVTTADKAEKYLDQAVNQFLSLAKSGKATPEMHSQINKAVAKHAEVLKAILNKVSDQSKPTIDQTIENSKANLEKIKNQFE